MHDSLWEILHEAESEVDDLSQRLPEQVDFYGRSTITRLGMKIDVALATQGYRITDLGRDVAELCKSGRVISAFLAGRALIESSAVAYYVLDIMLHSISNRNTKKAENHLEKISFGSKLRIADTKPLNVNDCLRSVGKVYPGVIDLYNHMSDTTHPNMGGGLATYAGLDEQTGLYTFQPFKLEQSNYWMAPPVYSVIFGIKLYQMVVEVVEDAMPIFIDLCETDARGERK